MALHFISTSILSNSNEGYNEEIKITNNSNNSNSSNSNNISLYEQLNKQNELKEIEKLQNNKLLFGIFI